jgi:hypothetical protein
MSTEESESDNRRGKLSANTDDACSNEVKAKEADLLEAQKTIAKLMREKQQQSLELRALKVRNQTLEELLNESAMSVTDNEHRTALSPLLLPIDTLKQLFHHVGMAEEEIEQKYLFNEFRLNRQPENVKAFVDLFDDFDKLPIVWITKNAFVCCDEKFLFPCAYREVRFLLHFGGHHDLSIHASTLEESIICLDFLVGLQDTHFQRMSIFYKDDEETRLCPFGVDILEKILQNSAGRIVFNYMIFTPDHCRILASCGTKTDIEFFWCEFQDEGAAFVEAPASRRDVTSGPAELKFEGDLPFNETYLSLFSMQHKLECLYLSCVNLESEVSCRAVATADVRCLTFGECELEDGGAALVESVRQGRGPKELCFDCDPFDSPERLVTFVNALCGNTNLERLELPLIEDRQITHALVAALRENKGLVHLEVCFRWFNKSDWTDLLESISLHASLCSLHLILQHSLHISLEKPLEATKAVADMLTVNERIEVMSFDDDTFDKDNWDAFVVPKLECNKYRKRFPSIQTIEEASTRAAVLARALAKFASQPHLVLMLLNQNHDILISSFLDSAQDLNSMHSRKRSLDTMSASNLILSN